MRPHPNYYAAAVDKTAHAARLTDLEWIRQIPIVAFGSHELRREGAKRWLVVNYEDARDWRHRGLFV